MKQVKGIAQSHIMCMQYNWIGFHLSRLTSTESRIMVANRGGNEEAWGGTLGLADENYYTWNQKQGPTV